MTLRRKLIEFHTHFFTQLRCDDALEIIRTPLNDLKWHVKQKKKKIRCSCKISFFPFKLPLYKSHSISATVHLTNVHTNLRAECHIHIQMYNHSCQMFQYSINIRVIMTSQFSYYSFCFSLSPPWRRWCCNITL